jgi:hypothetical protein
MRHASNAMILSIDLNETVVEASNDFNLLLQTSQEVLD